MVNFLRNRFRGKLKGLLSGIILIVSAIACLIIASYVIYVRFLSPNYSLQRLQLTSMGTSFQVEYIENSPPNSINPYFPMLRINTSRPHTAWLQIVYTDNCQHKNFIDAVSPDEGQQIYPCYSLNMEFYDAPLWQYSFFSKPLSYWKAHVYAVNHESHAKIMRVLGGVEWGFRLQFLQFYPIMIKPRPLNQDDFEIDRGLFKPVLNSFYCAS